MLSDLLPGNATAWERAVGEALDTNGLVSPAIVAIRGTKLLAPPPSFLPFLIYEYGLGELTPYVPNLYDLIAEGIDWQRVRGTPEAMALALSWLGYTARIEEEETQRRFWNMFQLELDRIRDSRADLDRIAGVAALSVPKRSVFWRGFHGLDIRPLTFSQSHYSESHFGEYSGVRLRDGAPLWSFGRIHDFAIDLAESDLTELGVWTPPVEDGAALSWGAFTWASTNVGWQSSAALARSQTMSSGVIGRKAWFAFMDEGGDIIGYRRARAHHWVAPNPNGVYSIASLKYKPKSTVDTRIYLECQTGFGDGAEAVATSVGVVFDGVPVEQTAPGTMWLGPDGITGATPPVAVTPVNIVFGETIRERVKMLFRF